jgi:hypothetical protein
VEKPSRNSPHGRPFVDVGSGGVQAGMAHQRRPIALGLQPDRSGPAPSPEARAPHRRCPASTLKRRSQASPHDYCVVGGLP